MLRGNRFLGTAILDTGLIEPEALDQANPKLLDYIKEEDVKNASLLRILLFELQLLDEAKLLDYTVQQHNLGLVDLHHYKLEQPLLSSFDIDLCWATRTMPFDKVEDVYFLSSCYYLSVPVVKHWEEFLEGKIVWYASPMMVLTEALETWEEKIEADQPEAEATENA